MTTPIRTDPPAVHYSVVGHVAHLVIDRPAVRNAVGITTVEALLAGLARAEGDRAVRVVVITGAGDRAFASGADLDELAALAGAIDDAIAYDTHVGRLYTALRASPLPVIARVQAAAIGGGLLLALACDHRIAADTARFAMPAARVGVMPSAVEHRLLVEAVGPARARSLLLMARRLDAAHALAIGLVDEVVPSSDLDDAVARITGDLLAAAPRSIAATKRLLPALDAPIDAMALRAAYASIYTSADLREGISAFKARRAPRFTGD